MHLPHEALIENQINFGSHTGEHDAQGNPRQECLVEVRPKLASGWRSLGFFLGFGAEPH